MITKHSRISHTRDSKRTGKVLYIDEKSAFVKWDATEDKKSRKTWILKTSLKLIK